MPYIDTALGAESYAHIPPHLVNRIWHLQLYSTVLNYYGGRYLFVHFVLKTTGKTK
jgi:hypothetical protein